MDPAAGQVRTPQDEADFVRSFRADDEMVFSDDEIAEREAGRERDRQERLNALGLSLCRLRSEAIEGREQTGIENEWIEDLEHYEGIDNANRHEFAETTWRNKPPGQAAVRTKNPTGSTLFLNITRSYCDSASARFTDMLQPVDERAWEMDPTPVPELAGFSKGQIPAAVIQSVQAAFPQQEGAQQDEILMLIKQAEAMEQEGKNRAELAQRQIDDWMAEARYHAEVRRIIEDATQVGTGVLKGPIPVLRKAVVYLDGQLKVKSKLAPASRRVSCWNVYPDPSCGQSIHDGSYFWERDDITRSTLVGLLDDPNYIAEQIKEVLIEGPCIATADYDEKAGKLGYSRRSGSLKNQFEIWYFYGALQAEDLRAAGVDIEDGSDEEFREQHALIEMVNGRVIKATLNPIGSGDFPYDFMIYQRREGMPWGSGVSRQIRAPQRMIVGASRNMMDNAGLSGGGMFVIDDGVEPTNGVYEIIPRKTWRKRGGDDRDPRSPGIHVIGLESAQQGLQAIIELGLRMAEDVTGLPMIMQGQVGGAPDTLGGMQMLQNNASAVLRRIARVFDDNVTEPHVQRYHRYLLEHGEDPNAKGDLVVRVRASSALVERDLQNMMIQNMAAIVTNPVFGADPKKWFAEYLKSSRIDPRRVQYDDDQWQQIVEGMAQQAQQQSPALEVANLRAQTAMQIEQVRQEARLQEFQWKGTEADKDRALQAALSEVDAWMDQEERAGSQQIELERIRSRFAEMREKLAVQVMLSREAMQARSAASTEVKTPLVEPVGRAPDGQSYAL